MVPKNILILIVMEKELNKNESKAREIARRWSKAGVRYEIAFDIATEVMAWKDAEKYMKWVGHPLNCSAEQDGIRYKTVMKSFEPTKGWTERVDEYINDMYQKNDVEDVSVTMATWGDAVYPTVHVILVLKERIECTYQTDTHTVTVQPEDWSHSKRRRVALNESAANKPKGESADGVTDTESPKRKARTASKPKSAPKAKTTKTTKTKKNNGEKN